jgi:Flp pilus assembly protein TadD
MTKAPLDPLSRLAILQGTDKFGYHDYTPNYHQMLKHLRDEPIRLLELGVGGFGDEDRGGESLAVWRDYFPNAKIVVGIDIQKKTLDLGPRVTILQGSQVDEAFLMGLVRDHGPFDVIIDDGSHRNEHVVESFRILWPTLVDGGIYIAEDVQTSFHPRFGGSLELTAPNSVGHFSDLMVEPAADQVPQADRIDRLERFHNIFAVHKRPKGTTRAKVATIWDTPQLKAKLATKAPRIAMSAKVKLPAKVEKQFAKIGAEPVPFTARSAGEVGRTPCDIVLATAADAKSATGLMRLVRICAADGVVAILSPSGERDLPVMRDMLAQVDHVEMIHHFPNAKVMACAHRIYSVHSSADGLLLQLGDNTYPSNFGWNGAHPHIRAAMATIEQVLQSEEASQNGLLQYADMLFRSDAREAALPVLIRLGKLNCKERRYFQMMGQTYHKRRDNDAAMALYREALDQFPNDPQFAASLAGCKIHAGDEASAESVLRSTLDANPRARPVVVMLAKMLERRGQLDEALSLYETSINLLPKTQRLPQLLANADLAMRANAPDRAGKALKRALTIAPQDASVLAAIKKFDLQIEA